MADSTQLGVAPCQSLGFASIGATYAEVGTTKYPSRMILFQNFTDATVWWSFDGVNDNFPMLPNGYFVLDICTNQDLNQGMFLDVDRNMFVRYLSGAPTLGSVYFTYFYAVEY